MASNNSDNIPPQGDPGAPDYVCTNCHSNIFELCDACYARIDVAEILENMRRARGATSSNRSESSQNDPDPPGSPRTPSGRRGIATLISITQTGKNIYKYKYKYENETPSPGYELVIKDTRNVPDDNIIVALEGHDNDEENEEDVSDTPILEIKEINILPPETDDNDEENEEDVSDSDTPILDVDEANKYCNL